jgi:hypothetical protein
MLRYESRENSNGEIGQVVVLAIAAAGIFIILGIYIFQHATAG